MSDPVKWLIAMSLKKTHFVFQDFCGANKEWRLEYDSTSGWTCGEMLSFGAPDLPGEQV